MDADDTRTERVETLVSQLEHVLTNPGPLPHAVARLNRADMLFFRLDRLLRTGAPLPSAWQRPARRTDAAVRERVTAGYDALSEVLRTQGTRAECAEALAVAAARWELLTLAMRQGAPLPDVWCRD